MTSIASLLASLYRRTALGAETRTRRLSRLTWGLTHPYVITKLRGRTAGGAPPVSLAVVGTTQRAEYLAEMVLKDSPQRTLLGTVPLWSLPHRLEQLSQAVDLTVVRLHPQLAGLLSSDRYLCVPEWVDQWLTMPPDPDLLCQGKSGKSLRRALRRARDSGITCELSHSGADLEEFYHTYHLPFVRCHFGSYARIDSLPILRGLFEQGGLMWALHRGERVAGSVFTRQGTVLRLLTFATMAGRDDLTELGVHTALNWSEIKHAHTLGCQEMNFGGARGLLTDGVLRHKRKWHTTIVERGHSHLYLLRWETLNPAVCAMLAAAPVVLRGKDHLAAVSLLDTRTPASQEVVTRAYRFLWTPGLGSLHLVCPSGFQEDVEAPPPTRLVAQASLGSGDLSALLRAGTPEHKPP